MPELQTHLFTIGVAGRSGTAILLCSGPMVQGSIERLHEALAAAVRSPVPVVEVDLQKVSRIDREAAAALMQARHDLARQGRELRLAVNSRLEARLRRLGAGSLLNPPPPAGAEPAGLPRGAQSASDVRSRDLPVSEEWR